jgi:hypothetical protein
MAFPVSRRAFLGASLALLASPSSRMARAEPPARQVFDYSVEIGVLFNLFSFSFKGTAVKDIDRAAGRYRVTMNGEGDGISLHTDASGIIRQGRFMPLVTHSNSTIRGRESQLDLLYDHDRGIVEYHSFMHTFFLGRRRQVDDTLKLPSDRRVDDLLSAELNFVANMLEQDPDGTYRTFLVRRSRPENEAPDEVSSSGYRAELVPLRFQVKPGNGTGRLNSLIDITSFSSWARSDQPARVTFTADRHLESVQSKLILGTTFKVRLAVAS